MIQDNTPQLGSRALDLGVPPDAEVVDLRQNSEVRAFQCPSCHALIMIGNDQAYVTILGKICFGENVDIIKADGLYITRICIKCMHQKLNTHQAECSDEDFAEILKKPAPQVKVPKKFNAHVPVSAPVYPTSPPALTEDDPE